MSKFLDDLVEFIKTQPFNVIRISEVKDDGEIETYSFGRSNPCQNIYSGAKVYAMTAIGLLYDRGLVALDEKIVDIFEDELPEGIDPRWENCTVEMVVAHRAGIPGGFLDIDCEPSTNFGEDFLEYLFKTPLAYDPGTEERYSDGAYYLLSRIVSKKTGMTADNYLWKEILFKLGFLEMAWSHCPKGYPIGATGMYISSEDMVKMGMVYLNNGIYRGQRVLSEEWCKMAVEKQFTFEWDSEHKIYFKGGMHGQKLFVSPEQNRVVAMQSFGANTNIVCDWIKNYKK